jgi:hypothetical protein
MLARRTSTKIPIDIWEWWRKKPHLFTGKPPLFFIFNAFCGGATVSYGPEKRILIPIHCTPEKMFRKTSRGREKFSRRAFTYL